MPCDSRRFFEEYFSELERRGIAAVILHSYEDFPGKIGSDVDYAVADRDLPKIPEVLRAVADRHGWVVAQTLRHQVFAFYSVVIDPENPREHLKLDVCSHYVKDLRFLLRDSILLRGRTPLRGFSIPAPSSEFIYVLAKIFGKNKEPGPFVARLRELYGQDPAGAEREFEALFGATGLTASEWLERPTGEWARLDRIMRRRHRYGPFLLAREAVRRITRMLRPTGLNVALLGSDGTGKTTLLSLLKPLLEPCFRKQILFHFRPMLLEKPSRGVVTDPHGQPPRHPVACVLKVFYYYLDTLLGHFVKVLPAKVRSTLVLFDRNFWDLLVDQRRYRLKGTRPLAAFLARLLPSPDITLVLEGTPETIHLRKPELGVEELRRQRRELLDLVQRIPRCTSVSADEPAEKAAGMAAAAVIRALAARWRPAIRRPVQNPSAA